MASRFCDWVVAVCDKARRNLLVAPFSARKKIIRIYNGAAEMCTSGESSPPNKDFTLLHVGRLTAIKDQESLLRAFASAKQYFPDLQLWIVGDGPLRPRLEKITRELCIESTTHFFGEQLEVAPFYLNADLFVMSSLSEGLPMSLLEAMSTGLPSIVTDVGGMREVGHLSKSSILVPPSNYEALAAAICKVVGDRSAHIPLKRAARDCYERYFTLSTMAEEYLRLYKNA